MFYENSCRLCLTNKENNVHIMNKYCQQHDIFEKIRKYFFISFSVNDNLPNFLCQHCLKQVISFTNFIEIVNKTQIILSKTFEKKKTEEVGTGSEEGHLLRHFKKENLLPVRCFPDSDNVNDNLPTDKGKICEYKRSEIVYVKNEAVHLITNFKTEDLIADKNVANLESNYNNVHNDKCKLSENKKNETVVKNDENQLITNFKKEDLFANRESTDVNGASDIVHNDKGINSETNTSNNNIWNDDILSANSSNKIRSNLEPINPVIMVNGRCVLKGKALTEQLEKFYDLVCDKCETIVHFEIFEELLDHFRNVHGIKGYVRCCKNKMTRRNYMVYHMCRHLQPDAFRCETCNKLLASPEMLRSHMYSHRPAEERPHSCSVCDRKFIFRRDLTDHEALHLPKSKRPSHICDSCGQKFESSARLSIHKSSIHNSDMLMCHMCAKQFRTITALRKHHLHHHALDEEVRVQCDQCGKWLKKMCLPKHVKNMHGIRSHPCQQCSHVSPSLSALRMHVKNRHSVLPNQFICQFCNRGFRLKKNLQQHLSQHTGERKFVCEYCDRRFASSGNYYSHRKQMHSCETLRKKNS